MSYRSLASMGVALAGATIALAGCGSSSTASYCSDERALNSANPLAKATSPDQVKSAVSVARSEATKVRDEAPDQIKAQFSTAVATLNKFFDLLDSKGYDITKLNASDAADLSKSDFTSATSAIDSYDSASCSITKGGSGTSAGSSDSGAATGSGGGGGAVSTDSGATSPSSSDTGSGAASSSATS